MTNGNKSGKYLPVLVSNLRMQRTQEYDLREPSGPVPYHVARETALPKIFAHYCATGGK